MNEEIKKRGGRDREKVQIVCFHCYKKEMIYFNDMIILNF